MLLSDLAPNSVKDNTIGDAEPAARNLISGNGGGFGDGVTLTLRTTRWRATSSAPSRTGSVPWATRARVCPSSLPPATASEARSLAPNTIAFNNSRGVAVNRFGIGNRILGNSIFSNGGLSIDLIGNQEADGRTATDPGDADAGPNALQNFLEIESSRPAKKKKKKTTTITGTLNSTPGTAFTVQFFSSPSDNPGEGKRFIGSRSMSTNGEGNASFSIRVVRGKAPVGSAITGTATDLEGNTSEFSDPVRFSTD